MGALSEFINHHVTPGFFFSNWHFLKLEIKRFSFQKFVNTPRSGRPVTHRDSLWMCLQGQKLPNSLCPVCGVQMNVSITSLCRLWTLYTYIYIYTDWTFDFLSTCVAHVHLSVFSQPSAEDEQLCVCFRLYFIFITCLSWGLVNLLPSER